MIFFFEARIEITTTSFFFRYQKKKMLSSRSGISSVVRDKMLSARRAHNIAWVAFCVGLGIVGTCMQAMTFDGVAAKQYNTDGAPLNMWWRIALMFGLCAVYLAINMTFLLIPKNWLFYLQYIVQLLAFFYTMANMICDIVVWRQRDTGDYPVVYYAQTEFIMRFWAVNGLLVCHAILAIASGNLFSRLQEMSTAKLVMKSQFDLEEDVVDVSSGERMLNNLYSQIRLEQYAFALFFLFLSVSQSFRAASFMSYVWSNGPADFWVTWAWWRNLCDMFTFTFFAAPIALYFLLGGFFTRNISQYLAGAWLVGVNFLNIVVLAIVWSECNTLNGAELEHPECGTGPTNQVQVWFLWNIYSAIGTAACTSIIYTIFFSANHTLREVSTVYKEVKRLKKEEAALLLAQEEVEDRVNEDMNAHHRRMGITASDVVHQDHFDHMHDEKTNGFYSEDQEHVGMLLYSLRKRLGDESVIRKQISARKGN